ncbi:glucosyltransferase [Microbacterium phage Hendrix]|uniref:Glycosyltransferase n=1 Tax=Microbacterium phage Hendrix TaxID=2182341 RepID=A0A2U8UUT2_9CAUD|nr:glucosyltransferase [Microbacterium phage Hendrix]AWN07822.1 glycosyltransferase [Microbacterium phage Hendrix]
MSLTMHILHVPGADSRRDAFIETYRAMEAEHVGLNVCVHEDPQRRGLMPNWLEALACAVKDGNRWSLLMQDDADPVHQHPQQLKDLLDEALWYSPSPVLCLSHVGNVTQGALKNRVPYVTGPHLIWGAAVAVRQDYLEGLVEWAHGVYGRFGYPHDDVMMSAYANKLGLDTACTTVALFDQTAESSLLGHHEGSFRRPRVGIWNTRVIPFSSVPRSVRKATCGAPKQRAWLVSLGTPAEHPTHAYRPIRAGAVSWLPKDGA